MREFSIILVVLSIVVVGGGMFVSQSAPQESVVVALGCFVAILARIAQATAHHQEIFKKQEE